MHSEYSVAARVRAFIDGHDRLPAFYVAYLVLTLCAAFFLNLGAFAVVVCLHVALDVLKFRWQARRGAWIPLLAAFHENLIECTLFAVALAFSVYVHHMVGIVGMSGVLRAEASLLGFVLFLAKSSDLFEGSLKIIAETLHFVERVRPDAHRGFTFCDRFYVATIAACALLLAFAPQFTGAEPRVIGIVILAELMPGAA